MVSCQVLATIAAFFFMLTWILSIASTALGDWWTLAGDGAQGGWGGIVPYSYSYTGSYSGNPAVVGLHEGLWQSCVYANCYPTNQYSGGCLNLLNVVRAFSILTIIFAFFAFFFCMLLACCICGAAPFAVIFGLLAAIFSIIPWPLYLGFLNQCVMPYVFKGNGWGLAVCCTPLSFLGMLFLTIWCITCYRPSPRPVAVPMMTCPCPCPAPMCGAEVPQYFTGVTTMA